MLPWAVKPILGLGSDLVPVMGFRKAQKKASKKTWGAWKTRLVELANIESGRRCSFELGFEIELQ